MKISNSDFFILLIPLLLTFSLLLELKSNALSSSSIEYRMTCTLDSVGIKTTINNDDTLRIITSLSAPGSPDGLFAYYPLDYDPNNSSILIDASGFGNDILINGATSATNQCGDPNGALFFDGTDNLIIPHTEFFEPPSISLSFWFRKTKTVFPGSLEKLCIKVNNPNRWFNIELKPIDTMTCMDTLWHLQMNTAHSLDTIGDDDSLSVECLVKPFEWHHVVNTLGQKIVGNDTFHQQQLFYDGIKIDSFSQQGAKLILNDKPFYFGSHGGGNFFNGDMDELRIYNRVLEEEEVWELYKCTCITCKTVLKYKSTCNLDSIRTDTTLLTGDTMLVTVTGKAGPISNQDQIVYLPLDSTDRLSTVDFSGFGHNGGVFENYQYPIDSCGRELGAIRLNEVYSWQQDVELTYNKLFDAPSFSISLWFKKNNDFIFNSVQASNNTDAEGLVKRGYDAGAPTSAFLLSIVDKDTGDAGSYPFDLSFNVSNSIKNFNVRHDSVIFPERWYHVVATFSEEQGCLALYLNGDPKSFCDFEGSINYNMEWKTFIGNISSDSVTHFNGDIDEFRLYNRLLTEEEIQILSQYKCGPSLLDTSICYGNSFFIGNQEFTETGIYDLSLSDVFGCDSLLTLNLSVLPEIEKTISDSICNGESYTIGNAVYTATGIYMDTLMAVNGCDSIHTLDLTVLPVPQTILSKNICAGDSFEVGNSVYTQSGNYIDTLLAANGCDSLIFLDLLLLVPIQDTIELFLCPNETIQLCDNIYSFEISGEYEIREICGQVGPLLCDSSIVYLVYVNEITELDTLKTLCQEETFILCDSVFNCMDKPAPVGLFSLVCCDTIWNVELICKSCDSPIPTVITPGNGDRFNEYFIIPELFNNPTAYPNNSLIIQDRWGNVLWDSEEEGGSYDNDWNGVDRNGIPLPANTYIYLYRPNTRDKALSGFITIIRSN